MNVHVGFQVYELSGTNQLTRMRLGRRVVAACLGLTWKSEMVQPRTSLSLGQQSRFVELMLSGAGSMGGREYSAAPGGVGCITVPIRATK